MHSSGKDEIRQNVEFRGQMFFSQRTTSFCSVAIWYLKILAKSLKMEDIKSNKNGHLLLLDAKTENQHFVLLNIYNTNIEKN